jgi:4-hydroxy-2-oxoheptanedioate aldolase
MKNPLRETLKSGKTAINGWVAIPSPYAVETYAGQGFDSVTIDMQHGNTYPANAVSLFQAVRAASPQITPMARPAWNDPAAIMQILDAGSLGIICPMINTRAQAEALVQSARYAPLGGRSFGPYRAGVTYGADYWKHANEQVLVFAMIETREALANLDDIIAVKGIDGVYLGPSDLSLSLGKTPTLAPSDGEVLAAMKTILTKTRAKGLYAGAHTDGAATALQRLKEGWQFTTLLNDVRAMATQAQAWGTGSARPGPRGSFQDLLMSKTSP